MDSIHLAVEITPVYSGAGLGHPLMTMACGVSLTTRYESLRYPGGFEPPYHVNVTCAKCLVAWDNALEKNLTDPVAELIEGARWE